MVKVEVIESGDRKNFEAKINDFIDQEILSENEIFDVKYSHVVYHDEIGLNHDSFSALILYRENKPDELRKKKND